MHWSHRYKDTLGPTSTGAHKGKGRGWQHGRLGVNGQQRHHEQTVSPLPSAGGYAAADVPLVNPHRSKGTTRSTLRGDGLPPKAATSLDTCRGYMAGCCCNNLNTRTEHQVYSSPTTDYPLHYHPSIHQTHPPKVQEGVGVTAVGTPRRDQTHASHRARASPRPDSPWYMTTHQISQVMHGRHGP
jgi:hypothetical protein